MTTVLRKKETPETVVVCVSKRMRVCVHRENTRKWRKKKKKGLRQDNKINTVSFRDF